MVETKIIDAVIFFNKTHETTGIRNSDRILI